MSSKTLASQVFIDGKRIGSTFPLDGIDINVNGGCTQWNRWKQLAQGNGSFSIGIDLSGFATLVRDQAINRSTLPGTLISKIVCTIRD